MRHDGDPVRIRGAEDSDRPYVERLLSSEGLEVDFVPDEFVVAVAGGRLVGCARLKPLPDGTKELASVAVIPDLRRHGVGRSMVERLLDGVDQPVHALAHAPGFFKVLGFVEQERVPAALEKKVATVCGDSDFVPMRRDPHRN